MKGRKPKPTVLKLLAGNPGKRAINSVEPQYEVLGVKEPHVLLEEKNEIARSEWVRVVPLLVASGVAKDIDSVALLAYCLAYQHWYKAEELVRIHGPLIRTSAGWLTTSPAMRLADAQLSKMREFLSDFGMTPTSRVRIKCDLPASHTDELEEYLKRGKSAS